MMGNDVLEAIRDARQFMDDTGTCPECCFCGDNDTHTDDCLLGRIVMAPEPGDGATTHTVTYAEMFARISEVANVLVLDHGAEALEISGVARVRYTHEQALAAYYSTANLYFMELARAAY